MVAPLRSGCLWFSAIGGAARLSRGRRRDRLPASLCALGATRGLGRSPQCIPQAAQSATICGNLKSREHSRARSVRDRPSAINRLGCPSPLCI